MDTQGYKVSVLILTYNQQLHKILETIGSILLQKEIRYEIVIADDGSKKNNFNEIKFFFEQNGFKDYRLINNKENQGTVKNALSGVLTCLGEFVKMISPGDLIYGERTLFRWVCLMEESEKKWSFSDVYNYKSFGDFCVFQGRCHPQVVQCYRTGNDRESIRNYILFNDIALGAATICDRKLLEKYLKEIVGKVMYAEDNIYRLMMMDNYTPFYFQEEALLYEVGCGVSTANNSEWNMKLKKDWDNTTEMIMQRNSNFINKGELILSEEIKKMNKLQKLSKLFKIKGYLLYKIKCLLLCRKSKQENITLYISRVECLIK